MDGWYYIVGGQTVGPVGLDMVRLAIRSGAIMHRTLVWRNGMGEWREAHATELQSLLRAGFSAFRDPTRLTTWLKVFLLIDVVLAVVATVSGIFEYRMLVGMQSGIYGAHAASIRDANDLRQGIIGMLQLPVFLAIAPLFLVWIYRANQNARELGARDLTDSPGWAVGWYFIPFANLVKPYTAMKEIWQASASPTDWRNQPVSPILGLWWCFWIISNALGQAAFRYSVPPEGRTPDPLTVSAVTMSSDAVDILLGIVAVVLVGRICQMQMARVSESRTQPTDPMPVA